MPRAKFTGFDPRHNRRADEEGKRRGGSQAGDGVLEEINQPGINPLELATGDGVLEEINQPGINPLELVTGDGVLEEINQPRINPLELVTGVYSGDPLVLEEIRQHPINPLELGSAAGENNNAVVLGEINQAQINPLELENGSGESGAPLVLEEINQLQINPLEKKRRGARGKSHPSGCLYRYLKNKKLKDGTVATYPRVEGRRDIFNDTHWYWAYNFEEKDSDGFWRNRSLPVPKFRVRTVRQMIDNGAHVNAIKALVKGEFSH